MLEERLSAAITATASLIVSAWEQAGRPIADTRRDNASRGGQAGALMKLRELADAAAMPARGRRRRSRSARVAGIDQAQPGDITFVDNPRYVPSSRVDATPRL